jgi:hypothetical protein
MKKNEQVVMTQIAKAFNIPITAEWSEWSELGGLILSNSVKIIQKKYIFNHFHLHFIEK